MATLRLTPRQWANYHRGLAGEVTRRLAERRDALILAHMPMAQRVAGYVARRHLAAKFAPHIDMRDLVQSAYVGLVQAADRYRPEDGTFSTFAYLRVRGAIIDAHRRKQYQESLHASLDELLEHNEERHLWWGSPSIRENLIARGQLDPSPLPDDQAAESERQQRLKTAIATLSPEHRAVMERALAGRVAREIGAERGYGTTRARKLLRAAKEQVITHLNKP